MIVQTIRDWITAYPYLFYPALVAASYGLYRLLRLVLARGLYFVAIRTKNIYDDLIVDRLHPFRVAWLLPLILVYVFADLAMGQEAVLRTVSLFLIIVVSADFGIALLGGLNDVYENRPRYTGKSIAAYMDLLKVLVVVIAVVLGLLLLTQLPLAQLLAGFGAWLAVLLLIFRDTILNLLASIQISTQELVKDGDWIEVPDYDANGIVTDITLNAIKVLNFDHSITVIPTYKIVEVAYRNWRGIDESGGRRLKMTFHLDTSSIRFCDRALLEKLAQWEPIADFVDQQIAQVQERPASEAKSSDSLPDRSQITNVELFIHYIEAYLKGRKDIRQRRFPLVVRLGELCAASVPVDVFVFARKTKWAEFEVVRREIMLHLTAALPSFGLKL
jgi:miniconductance mechanosensitive channel